MRSFESLLLDLRDISELYESIDDSISDQIDLEEVAKVPVAKKFPLINNYASLCNENLPHLNYQLFNQRLETLKFNTWKLKLLRLRDPKYFAAGRYNPIYNELQLVDKNNQAVAYHELTHFLGSRMIKTDDFTITGSGFFFTYDARPGTSILGKDLGCITSGRLIGELYIDAVVEKYMGVDTGLDDDLKILGAALIDLLGDEALHAFTKGQSFDLGLMLIKHFGEEDLEKIYESLELLYDRSVYMAMVAVYGARADLLREEMVDNVLVRINEAKQQADMNERLIRKRVLI